MSRVFGLVGGALLWAGAWVSGGLLQAGESVELPGTPELSDADRVNLERNLRWMLARERKAQTDAGKSGRARVGVFADAGVWHVGAAALVEALEKDGVPCRLLDRTLLTADVLPQFEAIVLPGGWAPFQWAAAGERGLAAIKGFVEGGGRCLGVCAGAFLLARETRWEGRVYPYPLGLFDGSAEGPIAGLAPWPKAGPVRLRVTEEGRRRGLGALASRTLLYGGGPRFRGGTGVALLALYPDDTPAAVARPVGKGEVVLIGAHPERPSPAEGDDRAPPPAGAGSLLRALLGLKR